MTHTWSNQDCCTGDSGLAQTTQIRLRCQAFFKVEIDAKRNCIQTKELAAECA